MSSGYDNLKYRQEIIIPHNIQVSVWQVQIQGIAIWTQAICFNERSMTFLKNLPNAFGIADDFLVVGYDSDGKDHDEMLWQVLQICRHMYLKLNKDKCHFRFTSVPFWVRWFTGMEYNLTHECWKHWLICHIPGPKGTPSTADVCESLRKLMSANAEWTWNAMFQSMFDKAKAIIKEDAYIKFYDETKQLHIERGASGVGLGAAFLLTRSNTSCARDWALDNSILRPPAFSSKSLTRAVKRSSNIEREALGILYHLEEFHYYCFVREVSIIMNHRPLVAIFKKGCSYIIIEVPANSVKNTSIQGENHILTWTRPIHSGLAVQTKPQWKQRWRSTRHVVKY